MWKYFGASVNISWQVSKPCQDHNTPPAFNGTAHREKFSSDLCCDPLGEYEDLILAQRQRVRFISPSIRK
jgi:hypothetical protein